MKTNSKTYQRGLALAGHEGSIEARRCDYLGESAEISAEVRSASGIAERFVSHVYADHDCNHIEDYSCTCPAAHKFNVMCKHCVALALEFRSDPQSFMGFEEDRAVKTSKSIARFLDTSPHYGAKRLTGDKARLDVTLVNDFGAWSVRLDISTAECRYVISDIAAFAEAFRNRTFHSYGKKLSFVHTPESFTDASQKIAGVISDALSERRSRTTLRGGDSVALKPRREMDLLDDEVIAIMDILGKAKSTFAFIDVGNGQTERSIGIVNGNPEFTLRIVEDERGGYLIVRDESLILISSGRRAYAIVEDEAFRLDSSFMEAMPFLRDVYLSSDDELFFSNEDAPAFCASALPKLEEAFTLVLPEELVAMKPKEAAFSFYFDKAGKGSEEAIELEVRVDYNSSEHVLLAPISENDSPEGMARNLAHAPQELAQTSALALRDKGEPIVLDATPVRSSEYHDEGAELSACELAFEYFDVNMRIPLSEEEHVGRLLYEGLAEFQRFGEVFTTPDFDRLLNDKQVRIQMGLSIRGNLIDLDIQPTDVSKDELAQIMSSYARKKKYHKLKSGVVLSLESLEIEHLAKMMDDLGIKASELSQDVIELPTYKAFFLDREYAQAHRDKSFEDYIDAFEDGAFAGAQIPRSLSGILRPYQADGFKWLDKLASMGFGGVLADEMGLGKSVQLIAFILSLKERNKVSLPSLIVCPASLVYNWKEEIAKFAPSLNVVTIDGNKTERRKKRKENDVDVFIASYDIVRMDSDSMQEIDYLVVALDEAQFIKNHATKTTRAVKRLKSKYRFALTGTPIENRLSEIWSIFDFLMPGFLGSYMQFRRRFEMDIIGGDEDAARRLNSLIGPFVLRRLKENVLSELPEKQESIVSVALSGKQKELYFAHEQNLREDLRIQKSELKHKKRDAKDLAVSSGLRVDVLAELMRLRQVALDPSLLYEGYGGGSAKTDAIIELVSEAMEAGKKSLVFSQFTSYLDILKRELEEREIPYFEITGSTPKAKRIELVNQFNSDETPVFLASLKAGGTGLNLIGASVVIHADPWWNAAATNQATDRAHRIGQDKMVSVYKVIAKDTIEERILRLQEAKSELADSVVSESTLNSLYGLTREELEDLLLY